MNTTELFKKLIHIKPFFVLYFVSISADVKAGVMNVERHF